MASIILSWSAAPANDNVTNYDIYGANGTSVVFGSTALLQTVGGNTLTWTDVGLPNSQTRTYYIVARNAVGAASPDGPINITTDAPSSVYVQRAGDTMTGPLTLSGDPGAALQAATKQYVDNAIAGLTWKAACVCATTASITLLGEQSIDGVTTSASRVLVKNQALPVQNGIYVSGSGAWARAADMTTGAQFPGAAVFIEQGSTLSETQWVCTNTAPPTVGVTSIGFTQFSAGSSTPGGSSGQLQYNNAGAFAGFTVSGDGTLVASTGVLTIASIGGVSPGAFFAGTNAANLTGTLAAARIASASLGLAKIANASANSVLVGSGASGSGAAYTEIALGTGLTMTGTTLSASSGSGTVTHTAGSLTSGQVVIGNGAADVTVLAPPSDAKQFLNGAATPAYALVKDSDLSVSNITTNNVSTSAHGFAPIAPNDATKFLDGTGSYSVPATGGGGSPISYTVPNIAGFTWLNQGSSAATQTVSGGSVLMNLQALTPLNWRALTVTQPSTPYKVKAQLSTILLTGVSGAGTAGIYFYNSSNGKLVGLEFLNLSSTTTEIRVERITNSTTDNSAVFNTANLGTVSLSDIWFQLRNDGTTLSFDISRDGVNFLNLYSEAVGAFVTPTSIGFGGATQLTGVFNKLWVLNWLTVGNANLN